MRVIAFMNQKGGVGKTTTAVNVGAALAEQGQRVCLIDLDPQAHLTINYGIDPSSGIPTLYDVLVEERSILEAMIRIDERIAIVPGSIDLAAAEVELVTVIGRETLLRHRMEAAEGEFDFVLLDCPPSLGLLTINALTAADEVLVPVQCEFLPLEGLTQLQRTIDLVRSRLNQRLGIRGVVLTMYDTRTNLAQQVVQEVRKFYGGRVFSTIIPRNVRLSEAPSYGEPILDYAPGDRKSVV